MKLIIYTRQEVFNLPVNEIRQMNDLWRTAIKEHYGLWTYELLKRSPRDFDEFLLDQEELKELHFQFRWESMDWKERLMAKNPRIKNKNINDYQYDYQTDECRYVKDFWDGSE
jgi:hypothetical protein